MPDKRTHQRLHPANILPHNPRTVHHLPATATMSDTLRKALRMVPKHQIQAVLRHFKHWLQGCQRVRTEDPASVAYSLNDELDERMVGLLRTDPRAGEVKCRRGCAACCHVPVDLYPQEAVLLRAYAADLGMEIDEARLDRQAEKTTDTWAELAPADRRCVFLAADDSCSVHGVRPGVCRKYLVITEPEFCDTYRHPGHEVLRLFSMEAEIIHSAAMTTFGCQMMALQLIAARPATTVPATPRSHATGPPGALAGV